jgi:hypothetical protein
MAHPLDSSIQRIHEAGHKFMELQDAFARVMDGPSGYRAVVERDPDGRALTIKAHVPGRLPPRWGAMISEPFDRTRSCLDQLARALVVVGGNQPDHRTAFPIARDETDFKREAELHLRGVTPESQAIIESLQPFRTGSAELDTEPLWLLHEFNAIQPHRVLQAVEVSLTSSRFEPTGSPEPEVEKTYEREPGPVADGALLARFQLLGTTETPVNVQTECSFDIAFQPRVLPARMPVSAVLQQLILHVHWDVLPAFSAFFPRYPACSELDHPGPLSL